MGTDDSTSRSLLLRVRDNDQDAWRRLVEPVWAAGGPLVPHLGCHARRRPGSDAGGLRGGRARPWRRTGRTSPARRSAAGSARSPATSSSTTSAAGAPSPRGAATRWSALQERRRRTDEPPDSSDGDSEVAALYLRALEQVRASSRSGPGRPSGKSRWSGARPPRSPPSWASPQRRPPGPVAGPPPAQAGAGRADRVGRPAAAYARAPRSPLAPPGGIGSDITFRPGLRARWIRIDRGPPRLAG